MRIVQANLGRGVSVGEFEANLDRCLDLTGERGFFLPQEIDEADLPREMPMLRFKTKRTHRVIGPDTAVPILVPLDVPIIGWSVTVASKGLARYTPHRPIVKARVELGGHKVSLFNGHVARRPRVPDQATATTLRQIDTRRAEFRTVLRRLTNQARDDGDAVVWALDTNTHGVFPQIVADEVPVINAGIDKARASAPVGSVEVTEQRAVQLVNLTIDRHEAHGARVWFKKEK